MPQLATPYHAPALTNAYRFGQMLQIAFTQQAAEAARRIGPSILEEGGEVPNLNHWPDHLAEMLRPTIVQLFQQGIVESRRRIAALGVGRPYQPAQRITPSPRFTHGKQLGMSFDLFDPRVLRAVDKATMLFCEETNDTAATDLKTAIRKLRQLLKAGLERGKAISQLAREVKRIFADPARAFRIAATETSRAVHGGALYNAKESNLDLKKEWVSSTDACSKCQELADIGPIELDEPFTVDGTGPYAKIMHPPLHPHCLLPETPVLAPLAVSGIVADYDGPIVRIDLTGGRNISVTANHLLLTPDGFLPASALVNGDYLLRYSVLESMTRRYPNHDWKPTAIEKVIHSFSISQGVATSSVPIAPEYLHGDARFCQGDIDIISANGFLRDNVNAKPAQPARQRSFTGTGDYGTALGGHSKLVSVLLAMSDASGGRAHRRRERMALSLSQSRQPVGRALAATSSFNSKSNEDPANGWTSHAKRLSQRLSGFSSNESFGNLCGVGVREFPFENAEFSFGPNVNPSAFEPMTNSVSANSARVRDACKRFARHITPCQVVNVSVSHYMGPVYDISTQTSMYIIADGVLSSNCFCTFSEAL